ncbi:hypothetical protein H5410_028369 [Solanum commersonii]|uniref:Peroxidase n=1 Tax=Solanum commersonii TaxID=4109 RepID=A0A9J5Z3U1_SOLCO|nr:hypothetical protein H5410_028369 [Solanum commersonii]
MATFGYLCPLILLCILVSSHAQLQQNFYAKSCPKAEKIILEYVHKHIPNAPSLAAALIRMHFHDCFVRGCDASVLLNFTSSTGNQTEKFGIPNLTLRGFSFIDNVKKIIEDECPGVVSCADIVALVARDSVVVTGGPSWKTLTDIPAPTSNFSTLQNDFARKGLDLKDLVLLSGAHTIGISHCSSFSTRLYNFTGTFGTQDPSLDSEYAANLKANKCKSINDNTTILLLKRRGLFQSDAALTTSTTTKSYIDKLVEGSLKEFYVEFAQSMEKMGRIEVKTGSDGEIRKHCAVVNS